MTKWNVRQGIIKKIICWITVALFGLPYSGVSAKSEAEDVQVMVLGVYHFANPGLDDHNVEVDSVLTPARQAELENLAQALAVFHPTQVVVEAVAPGPDYHIAEYEQFSPAMLAEDPNEIVQIGYRVANKAGLEQVLGIDVQPTDGEEGYYPIDQVRSAADRSGQSAILAELDEEVGGWAARFGESQSSRSIADLLLEINGPGFPAGQKFYDAMIPIISDDDLAGAHLNARWYARNVSIYAKLMRNAEPGDRILVIYGAGHNAWLRHFASTIEGHKYVDPPPYLELARNLQNGTDHHKRR